MPSPDVQIAADLIRSGKRDLARQMLDSLLQENPDDVDAWLCMSLVAKSPVEKKACLESALELDPGNRYAQEQMDRLPRHSEGGALQAAEPPANQDVLEQAVAAIKAGDKALGDRLLRQVLSVDPRNVWALLWLTKCTVDPYAIADLYQQALSIDPENPHAQKGAELYRKYARHSLEASQGPPSPPGDLLPTQFEPSPPVARAPSNRNLWIALGVCGIIILGALAVIFGPKAFRAPAPDPVASLRAMALSLPSVERCAIGEGIHDVAYDVQKTQSLVSPIVGTISGKWTLELVTSFVVTLAYQDGIWVPKSVEGLDYYSSGTIKPLDDVTKLIILHCVEATLH
jgi:tetratricopeptide (TPR) repeat protein